MAVEVDLGNSNNPSNNKTQVRQSVIFVGGDIPRHLCSMDQTLISQASEAVDSVSRNSLQLPVEDCLEATRDRHQHLEVVVSARPLLHIEIYQHK